jgi:hypothetical protein
MKMDKKSKVSNSPDSFLNLLVATSEVGDEAIMLSALADDFRYSVFPELCQVAFDDGGDAEIINRLSNDKKLSLDEQKVIELLVAFVRYAKISAKKVA